jgi:hypothetical protein
MRHHGHHGGTRVCILQATLPTQVDMCCHGMSQCLSEGKCYIHSLAHLQATGDVEYATPM